VTPSNHLPLVVYLGMVFISRGLHASDADFPTDHSLHGLQGHSSGDVRRIRILDLGRDDASFPRVLGASDGIASPECLHFTPIELVMFFDGCRGTDARFAVTCPVGAVVASCLSGISGHHRVMIIVGSPFVQHRNDGAE
jgi:hypothetical protein